MTSDDYNKLIISDLERNRNDILYIRKQVDQLRVDLAGLRGRVVAIGSVAALIVSFVISYVVKFAT